MPAIAVCQAPEMPDMSQSSQASQLPHLDLCTSAAIEEISDRVLGLPLGKPLSSLRTPLQTQWSGVAARFTNAQKRHCPLSVDAFLSSTVRPYGGCARDTLGYAGSIGNRSANLRTAATLHRVAAISGGSTYQWSFTMIKPTPNPPISLFTVADHLKTEDLLVNLTETLASAEALMSDFAFELDGAKREGALGVAQLIGLAKRLADRVLEDSERLMA